MNRAHPATTSPALIDSLAPATVSLPRYALMPARYCKSLLGTDSQGLAALIKSGALYLAFDLAVRWPNTRSLFAATSHALHFHLQNPEARFTPTAAQVCEEVEAIFAGPEISVRSPELQRLLKCSPQHVRRLGVASQLQVTRPGRRHGKNATQYSRASCVDWLLSRRVK